jgi:hypothetical protein
MLSASFFFLCVLVLETMRCWLYSGIYLTETHAKWLRSFIGSTLHYRDSSAFPCPYGKSQRRRIFFITTAMTSGILFHELTISRYCFVFVWDSIMLIPLKRHGVGWRCLHVKTEKKEGVRINVEKKGGLGWQPSCPFLQIFIVSLFSFVLLNCWLLAFVMDCISSLSFSPSFSYYAAIRAWPLLPYSINESNRGTVTSFQKWRQLNAPLSYCKLPDHFLK